MLIVDTNVVSELMRPIPDDGVARWFDKQPLERLAITAITVGEILYGLDLMADGRRKADLAASFAAVLERAFAGAVLPFENTAASAYARIRGDRSRSGRPISINDAMIAVIALTRGGTVVTRNVTDFEACGIDLIDPWRALRHGHPDGRHALTPTLPVPGWWPCPARRWAGTPTCVT